MTTQNATGPAKPLLDWALYLAAMGAALAVGIAVDMALTRSRGSVRMGLGAG